MIKRLKELVFLKENLNVIGIKQSFEDEGASIEDIILARRLTEISNLKSFVKIGGCEAKTDMEVCKKFGIDSIIAPMVESEFALSKFLSSADSVFDLYIVIETKTAYENLENLLKLGKNKLKGIVVGRSDLTKSFNLDKSEVDSVFINNIVHDILIKSISYNLKTTLGVNISIKSSDFIKNQFEENLLDRIETRNIVLELNQHNINDMDNSIKKILDFEINLLEDKLNTVSEVRENYIKRLEILSKRK